MGVVLVTGGNRGIGLEVCRSFYERGWDVIMGCRDIDAGEVAAGHIGPGVIPFELDITKEQSITKLAEFISLRYGYLDVLINNAGIGIEERKDPCSDGCGTSGQVRIAEAMFRVNFIGTYRVIQLLLPLLRKARIVGPRKVTSRLPLKFAERAMNVNMFGAWRVVVGVLPYLKLSEKARIVNVSSRLGRLEGLSSQYPAYSLSKAALNALTIICADELARDRIMVIAVCPGWVRTRLGGEQAPLSPEQGANEIVRVATSDDIETGRMYMEGKLVPW